MLFLSGVASAAPISIHAATGRVIGKVCDNPCEAFGLGVLSHIAMDVAPYHQVGVDWKHWKNYKNYIALEAGGLLAVALAVKDRNELAGVLGSVAPDLVDSIAALVTGDRYALPVHRKFPGYVSSPQLNKSQSELLILFGVSFLIKF